MCRTWESQFRSQFYLHTWRKFHEPHVRLTRSFSHQVDYTTCRSQLEVGGKVYPQLSKCYIITLGFSKCSQRSLIWILGQRDGTLGKVGGARKSKKNLTLEKIRRGGLQVFHDFLKKLDIRSKNGRTFVIIFWTTPGKNGAFAENWLHIRSHRPHIRSHIDAHICSHIKACIFYHINIQICSHVDAHIRSHSKKPTFEIRLKPRS